MGDFASVLPAYKRGEKVRRAKWPPEEYVRLDVVRRKYQFFMRARDGADCFHQIMAGLHCDDWEIAGSNAAAVRPPSPHPPSSHGKARVVAAKPRRTVVAAPAPARTVRRTEDA